MKNILRIRPIAAFLLAAVLLLGLGGCGTTSAHFGLDHDVAYNWGGGYFEDSGHHHHHKHKKKYYKKAKKHQKKYYKKAKKHHKKYYKRHHHDDD